MSMEIGNNLRVKDIVAQAKEKGVHVIIVESDEDIRKAAAVYGIGVDAAMIYNIEMFHPEDIILLREAKRDTIDMAQPIPVFPKIDIVEMLLESAKRMDRHLAEMQHLTIDERPVEFPRKSIKKHIPDNPKAFRGHTNTFKNHNFKRR